MRTAAPAFFASAVAADRLGEGAQRGAGMHLRRGDEVVHHAVDHWAWYLAVGGLPHGLVVRSLLIFGTIGGGLWFFFYTWKRSEPMQFAMDRLMLKMPIFGDLIRKATVARWTRTLSTMFAAGVPLVEALDSVGGASGNHVYVVATHQIQSEVSTGTSLTVAMQNAEVFPTMVVQMVSIGEESGQLDAMLGKVADFFEQEVDDAVAGLSQLLEPLIMVFLGTIIGAFIMSVLTNGLRIMSVAQEWQTVITGVIIILAVYTDILRRGKA